MSQNQKTRNFALSQTTTGIMTSDFPVIRLLGPSFQSLSYERLAPNHDVESSHTAVTAGDSFLTYEPRFPPSLFQCDALNSSRGCRASDLTPLLLLVSGTLAIRKNLNLFVANYAVGFALDVGMQLLTGALWFEDSKVNWGRASMMALVGAACGGAWAGSLDRAWKAGSITSLMVYGGANGALVGGAEAFVTETRRPQANLYSISWFTIFGICTGALGGAFLMPAMHKIVDLVPRRFARKLSTAEEGPLEITINARDRNLGGYWEVFEERILDREVKNVILPPLFPSAPSPRFSARCNIEMDNGVVVRIEARGVLCTEGEGEVLLHMDGLHGIEPNELYVTIAAGPRYPKECLPDFHVARRNSLEEFLAEFADLHFRAQESLGVLGNGDDIEKYVFEEGVAYAAEKQGREIGFVRGEQNWMKLQLPGQEDWYHGWLKRFLIAHQEILGLESFALLQGPYIN